jgi:hypothetical protein
MIERQKDTSRRRRLDVPSRVGSDADPGVHLVELRDWLTFNHLTSGVTEFAYQRVKLTKRKFNLA